MIDWRTCPICGYPVPTARGVHGDCEAEYEARVNARLNAPAKTHRWPVGTRVIVRTPVGEIHAIIARLHIIDPESGPFYLLDLGFDTLHEAREADMREEGDDA